MVFLLRIHIIQSSYRHLRARFLCILTQFPSAKYYGCPRHLKIFPDICWAGEFNCELTRQVYSPDLEMKVPSGAEFIDPQPPSFNHLSSCLIYHPASRSLHVNDTLNVMKNPSWLMRMFGFKDVCSF